MLRKLPDRLTMNDYSSGKGITVFLTQDPAVSYSAGSWWYEGTAFTGCDALGTALQEHALRGGEDGSRPGH